MSKKIFIDEDGYLKGIYKPKGTIEIEVSDSKFNELSVCKDYYNWRYLNGEWFMECLHEIESLRDRRQIECFDIIDNRSQMWFNHLTESQKAELDAWYEAWLNVTETKVVPTKPEWLK